MTKIDRSDSLRRSEPDIWFRGDAAEVARQTAVPDVLNCLCGSGLAAAICCKLDLKTVPTGPTHKRLPVDIDSARRAHRLGNGAEAQRLCLETLSLAPGQLEALLLLYEIKRGAQENKAAEALIKRAVALDPNNFWATNELTLLLMARGDLAGAETHARNAVRIAPENPQSHNLMGMVLTEQQRPQMGEFHYRQALHFSGARDPILLANLAWCLKCQGRLDEARTLYLESTDSAPDVPQTLLGWARLEEVDRNFTQSAELLDRAERVATNPVAVMHSRAVLLGRMQHYQEGLDVLDRLAESRPDGVLAPADLLEKGRMLDRLGRYEEAFAAFEAGKQAALARGGDAYMAEHVAVLSQRLRGFFTPSRLKLLPRAGVRHDTPQPIFIVGFPRSGTTLLEQTLSLHSQISAGDELPLIAEIAGIMPRMLDSPVPYPEALVELWMADHREGLDNLRDYYLQKARQLGATQPGRRWFTDKMPLNETHLGLIALMFPKAPLVHMVRHPLDVVLSVFSNFLTHGFYCAASLESAARHYVTILDLVDHYVGAMDMRYTRLRYEDLVNQQEASVSRALACAGEQFEPGCLRFETNRRYARTASYAQVTEKLYGRSCFRYRNYMAQLAPVIPILRPAIERLGYSI